MSHVVLVVEDETDIRKILCFNLRSEGYEVLEAGSAEEGMDLMSGQVSLILLDVMLPRWRESLESTTEAPSR